MQETEQAEGIEKMRKKIIRFSAFLLQPSDKCLVFVIVQTFKIFQVKENGVLSARASIYYSLKSNNAGPHHTQDSHGATCWGSSFVLIQLVSEF